MLDAAWDVGAIYFPFADGIISDPCAVFREHMGSTFYVGQSHVVGNTTTDIVAVAGNGVQAELWIGAEDHLPRMVRVTYPDEPAHAHYQSDYTNWKLGAAVEPGTLAPPRPRRRHASSSKPRPPTNPGSSRGLPSGSASVEYPHGSRPRCR